MMNVLIMTDLEGVAGVINAPDWIYPESRYYEDAKALLTAEVNAAADGFFAAGATRVLVQDGHGHGAINGMLLDERAELQRGWGIRPYPFGLSEAFDVVAWVGQHAKSGTAYAHLAHTGSFFVLDLSVNGISLGEFGQVAFCAVEYGVTPIFAAGDLAFTKEASALFPAIVTAAVKRGVNELPGDECSAEQYEHFNSGAVHIHPNRARRLIRDGAYQALSRYAAERNPDICKKTAAEASSSVFLKAPYTQIMKTRPTKDAGARVYTKYHETSITQLFNEALSEITV